MQQFEFHCYDEKVELIEVLTLPIRSEASARSKAGTLAKKNNGPVDLALAGNAEWDDRYLTTASPSEYHVAGFCHEKIWC